MVKFSKGRKNKNYFKNFKKWIGHRLRHNVFVENILEGAIS